jgi:hypothetical protein
MDMSRIRTALSAAVLVAVMGCDAPKTGETTKQEMELTEENHTRLIKAVPPPKLSTSQERKNLKRRLETFNKDSKISYIYLIDYGKVMGFHVVKGKVSSVNSKLTTGDQIVRTHSGGGYYSHVIESPQLDGSYGTNGDAIFFFTADGTYVEWNGRYMLCDKPLKMSTPPQLVVQVEDD